MATAVEDTFDRAFTRLESQLAVSQPGLTIAWEAAEDDFDPPKDAAWVRVTSIPGDDISTGLGASRWRYFGNLSVQIFIPNGKGPRQMWQIADSIRNAFRGYSQAGTRFRTGKPRRIGPDPHGPWYQWNLDTEIDTTYTP